MRMILNTYFGVVMLIFSSFSTKMRLFKRLLWVSLLSLPHSVTATEAPPNINNISVCMDFGCKNSQHVTLNEKEWAGVANWFVPSAHNAQIEREQIKQAIGWMEHVIGQHTPTHRDRGGNLSPGANFPGQLDCIDESLNTTTYLRLFETYGLLKHHKVLDRAYRRTLFDQHWAGQLSTIKGNEQWIVDSWFQHNGYLPYIQPTKEWKDIPLFTSFLDNSQPKTNKTSLLSRLFN